MTLAQPYIAKSIATTGITPRIFYTNAGVVTSTAAGINWTCATEASVNPTTNCTWSETHYYVVNDASTGPVVWTALNGISSVYQWPCSTPDPKNRLRKIIQERLSPRIIRNRQHLNIAKDIREIRARETLRRVIGEDKYRGFLRHGHISVRGKSGKVYQIFPGHGITKVYDRGQLIERLCVVLSGGFPPTDSLIMRYLLILNDENQFRQLAVSHQVYQETPVVWTEKERSLPEIFRSLKAA